MVYSLWNHRILRCPSSFICFVNLIICSRSRCWDETRENRLRKTKCWFLYGFIVCFWYESNIWSFKFKYFKYLCYFFPVFLVHSFLYGKWEKEDDVQWDDIQKIEFKVHWPTMLYLVNKWGRSTVYNIVIRSLHENENLYCLSYTTRLISSVFAIYFQVKQKYAISSLSTDFPYLHFVSLLFKQVITSNIPVFTDWVSKIQFVSGFQGQFNLNLKFHIHWQNRQIHL